MLWDEKLNMEKQQNKKGKELRQNGGALFYGERKNTELPVFEVKRKRRKGEIKTKTKR